MSSIKIGFIGYGNMAGATARGLITSGKILPNQIYACAKNYERLCNKAETDGIIPCSNSLEVVQNSDVIFIGVKPYLVEEVMAPLKGCLNNKILISLAANIYSEQLEKIIPGAHYVGTAPNTPVSVCEGIFICEKEHTLSAEEQSFVEKLLENIGLVIWMDKEHMGIGGVIAGCTPAFVAMFMEALGDAGCKHGLTRNVVYSLTAQMLLGSGKMALESSKHPGQLKDAVCSPAGTTIVGVETLEKNGFRFAVMDAIDQIQDKIHGKS